MLEGEKKIEKYQFSLKKQLGQGSYAIVYLGRVIQTFEPVAVKVIDKKIFSNAYNVKNIQSEIDIMKKVSHPNIVQLYDIYQTANNMYIVTELCQDGDLYRLLQKRKKLPESEAKCILRDIMNGAKYLHKNGIIHRDLKPANILIKDGVSKISDFGFAKSLSADETIMKSIVGTPLYMSPQILKKLKYTAKSDLWSIGLIYYEMLHGRTPWPANNQIELINGIYHKKIQFSAQISERSKDFIRGCLQIYEQDRLSWEEAFEHKLLLQDKKKSYTLEDKQNMNTENKGVSESKVVNKTPKHSNKQKETSGLSFKKRDPKDISAYKPKKTEECLTPKGKLTPKKKSQKSDRSGLKQRTEVTIKKETSISAIKKKHVPTLPINVVIQDGYTC